MRTLLFQSVHLQNDAEARLFDVACTLLRRLNPGMDLLLVDNASPIAPASIVRDAAILDLQHDDGSAVLREPVTICRFPDAIGHLSKGGQRDGPGRALCAGVRIAIDNGYDRLFYQEQDALCGLPAEWFFARMHKPVACQQRCKRHKWLDWNVWPSMVRYLKDADFIGNYNWHARNPETFEEAERWNERFFGDQLQVIPVRGERWEGDLTVEQFRETYSGGCDLITHVGLDVHAEWLRMNHFNDLAERLEGK